MNLARVVKFAARDPLVFTSKARRRFHLDRQARVVVEILLRRPTRIVEIGVWRGATARRLIAAARRRQPHVEYWGFDLFDEATNAVLAHEATPGVGPLTRTAAQRLLERPGVDLHLVAGDTTRTVPAAVDEMKPVHLVLIDGGHSYETVRADWENVQAALAPDAVVFFDDYIPDGAQWGYGVARLVDEIDRSRWKVRTLHPIDSRRDERGLVRTRLARVTPRLVSRPGRH